MTCRCGDRALQLQLRPLELLEYRLMSIWVGGQVRPLELLEAGWQAVQVS